MTTNFKDDDNLLVNRDGTDYRASAERLKSYVRERLPEEDPVTNEPNNFDANASQWTEPRPVWGTCPRGEDQS